MRWVGHVTDVNEMINAYTLSVGKRGRFACRWKIILTGSLNNSRRMWAGLVWLRVEEWQWALVNRV
jgi:hypothetical protein